MKFYGRSLEILWRIGNYTAVNWTCRLTSTFSLQHNLAQVSLLREQRESSRNEFQTKAMSKPSKCVLLHLWGIYAGKVPLQREKFTKRAYKAYFGIKLGDQDKSWAPHKVCKQCTETLCRWTQGKATSMRFGVPIVWREPKNHYEDWYFCMVDMTGWNQGKKKGWYYPDIESARRPVPNCTDRSSSSCFHVLN